MSKNPDPGATGPLSNTARRRGSDGSTRIARRKTQRLTPKTTHAIELGFELAGESTVLRVWSDLDRIGVPPVVATHHGSRPHLALAVCDDADPVHLAATVARETAGIPAPVVRLSHVGLFLHPVPILFLGVVATPELLHLHGVIQRAISWTADTVWGHFREGRWVPHVTLAVRFDAALLSGAIGVCRGGVPLETLGIRLHVVDVTSRTAVHAADLRVG